MKIPQQFQGIYQKQYEQIRNNNHETIRIKFQKKKILMNNQVSKKDLHFIINSMLQGQVFSEDILNQFWQSNFTQNALVSDIVKVYNQGIMNLLQNIVQNNLRIHELTKERQKYQKDHNFKYIGLASQQLDTLNLDNNQYLNDLQQLCKPFGLVLQSFITKYKPYRLKQKTTTMKINQDQEPKLQSQPENVFLELQKFKNKPIQIKQLQQDTPIQQKYYRFCICLTIIISLGDISLSYVKFNFIDILTDLLLLFNALLQNFLMKGDPFLDYYQYVGINYQQKKIAIFDNITRNQTFQHGTLTTTFPHSFERHTYSSMLLLIIAIFFDFLWILLIKPDFSYTNSSKDPYLLTSSLQRYNNFIAGASIVLIIIKLLLFIALFMTIDFEWKKLLCRYNLMFNFLRFTNQNYINQLIAQNNI